MTTKRARKPSPWNLKSRIRSALRKIWQWSPARREALSSARAGYGRYRCAKCPTTKLYGPREVAVDHIESATPMEGLTSWDVYIERLFCPPSGLQILCKPHHDVKTAQERAGRKKAA